MITLRTGGIRRKQEVLGINFAEHIAALRPAQPATCTGRNQRREQREE
jgi:hypothetical protein